MQVFSATSNTVSLSWIPSFGHGTASVDSVCDMCQYDGSLVQYASTATSPNPSKGSTNWAPHQATGPPGNLLDVVPVDLPLHSTAGLHHKRAYTRSGINSLNAYTTILLWPPHAYLHFSCFLVYAFRSSELNAYTRKYWCMHTGLS